MIERRRPPFGIAPPAGHVDEHGSFEDAARAELSEEVGLTATKLNLVLSGARPNPCRRPDGLWHYWRIYEAETSGTLKPSIDETKGARWYSLAEILSLHHRTQNYISGRITEDEWQARPGIEPVWSNFFVELKVIPTTGKLTDSTASSADSKWAREYAWKWWEYHAGQRIAIFRFFLITVAFLIAGYSTLVINGQYDGAIAAASFLAVATFLFWRFDVRNYKLVKLSEAFLKTEEYQVGDRLRRPELSILTASENKKKGFPWFPFHSFREIYAVLFIIVGLLTGLMLYQSISKYLSGAERIPEFGVVVEKKSILHIEQQPPPTTPPLKHQ